MKLSSTLSLAAAALLLAACSQGTSGTIPGAASPAGARSATGDAGRSARTYHLRAHTIGAATSYTIPTASSHPYGITVGNDGNLWFTEQGASTSGKIAKITTSGVFTEYQLPVINCGGQCYLHPTAIAKGPDGRVWATATGQYLVAMTTTGTWTWWQIPFSGSTEPGIVSGPNNELWFTFSAPAIVATTTSGTFYEYKNPSGDVCTSIAEGSDGNLWCVLPNQNSVARMTTGGSYTQFKLPYNGSSFSYPADIKPGSDKNLWVTDSQLSTSTLLKVTTGGVATQYQVPAASCCASALAPDGTGGFWLTDSAFAGATLTGTVTQYTYGHKPATPAGGAVIGPDGNLWLVDTTDNAIVKVTI